MSHVWKVVLYVESARKLRVRHGCIHRTIFKRSKERVICETHETEEAAHEAAKRFPGAVVEKERVRLDIDG